MPASKSETRMQWACWLVIIAAFPCVGFFIGWFVGMSRSPVVATLLPILFGVLGAMGFGAIERRAMQQRLHDCVEDFNDNAAAKQLRTALPEIQRPSLTAPAAWSLGAILFCIACYFGANVGIDTRLQTYPPLNEMIANAPVTLPEKTLLHQLRWTLMDRGVSRSEAIAFFNDAVADCLAMPSELETERFDALDELLKAATAAPASSRDVASDGPPIPAAMFKLEG